LAGGLFAVTCGSVALAFAAVGLYEPHFLSPRQPSWVGRAHIAARMWEWWFNEYSGPPDREAVTTAEQFRDTLELEVIRFEPAADAFLDYADHGLVCNYGIRIWVGPEGQFSGGPEVC